MELTKKNEKENRIGDFRFLPVTVLPVLTQINKKELAGLIYDTDPYIYPAMFGSRENALRILPLLFDSGDSMFAYDNIFVAEKEGHILGMVLWYFGRLYWSCKTVLDVAGRLGVVLDERILRLTETGYVSDYASVAKEGVLNIINVCVAKDQRGKGTGRQMLQEFLCWQRNRPAELRVLKDNHVAVGLYESFGFTIISEYNGFTIDGSAVRAAAMRLQGGV